MELINDISTDTRHFTEEVNKCTIHLHQCKHSGKIMVNLAEIAELMGMAPDDPNVLPDLMQIIKDNQSE